MTTQNRRSPNDKQRTVEVQVTAVLPLSDGEDATTAAEELLGQLRHAQSPGTSIRVNLNTVTLREGRKVLQRMGYKTGVR